MRRRIAGVAAAALVVAAVGWGTTQPAKACGFVIAMTFGTGGGADLCGPLTAVSNAAQVSHMVTQIGQMVEQLTMMQSIDDILTTDLPGVGNMGRLREAMDERWDLDREGIGLSTDGGLEGVFNQRIPGTTDTGQWLDTLAAPRLGDAASDTVLLGGRPATETTPEERSAFRSWFPGPGASTPGAAASREALDVLGDVAEGTATWRTVWNDIEAGLAPSIREQDLRALGLGLELTNRIVDVWRRAERLAGADLQHAHAIAEATSTLDAQVGETAAHLAALRDDDLSRTQRVEQSLLANSVSQTELLMAQAQVVAYEQARAARERYEAERERRERLAEWQAGMAAGAAAWDARIAEIQNERAARVAAHLAWPDPSRW